jgi:hypothetical protein
MLPSGVDTTSPESGVDRDRHFFDQRQSADPAEMNWSVVNGGRSVYLQPG